LLVDLLLGLCWHLLVDWLLIDIVCVSLSSLGIPK